MVNITAKYKNDKNQRAPFVLCDQSAGPLTAETWHVATGFQLIQVVVDWI